MPIGRAQACADGSRLRDDSSRDGGNVGTAGTLKDRMIGRAAERELLAGLIRSTTRGHGAIGVVEGAPGIGKTTLLRAWVEQARAAGLPVRQAAGRELEQGRPFGVMISALDVFGTAADPERTAAAGLLSRPVRDSSSTASGFDDLRYAIVDALAAVIERLALSGPAALVIDDLQWCDASSLIVLDRAFRLTGELPLAVVCASRLHPRSAELAALMRTPEAARAVHVGLGPLDGRAVEELVQRIIGAEPGPSVMRQALRCGGDPLFISELITGFAREGMLHRNDRGLDLVGDQGSGPPPTISMLALRHLSMLPRTTVDVLLIAAALGSRFSVRDLAVAAGRGASQLLPELRHAVDAGLLVEDADDMAFQHDLVREAIYDDIGPASRRALHRQIAEALATDGAPAHKVALHFAAAAEGKDPVAAEWLLRAGRETAPRDPIAAVALLRRAVEVADGALAADRTRITLAQALAAAGQLRNAESLLRSVIDRSPDRAVQAEARAAFGEVLHLLGSFSAAADELARAAQSRTLPESLRARLFAHALMDRVWSGGRIDTSEGDDPRAALAEARRVGDRLAEFYAVMTEERIARHKGSLSEAVRFAREAGRIASAIGPDDEITHHEMPPVAILIDADLFDEARQMLRSAPAWNDDRGGAVQPQRHFQQMRCDLALGDWDDALADGDTGLRLAEGSGTVWSIDTARAQLALIAVRRDEPGRADTLLRAIRADARGSVPEATSLVAVTEAYLAVARGDRALARRLLGNAEGLLDDPLTLRGTAALLAQLYVLVDAREEIRRIVRCLEPLAAGAGVASLDGLVSFCAALAGDEVESLLRAVETLRGTRRAVDLASACEEAGIAATSAELLSEALGLYERFGARRDAARTLARLRAIGVRPGRRGRRRHPATGWASLTPTERRIAELIAEGLLYKEVAERLVISRRTVETHVSHIFAKLSLETRLELTRLVRQQIAQDS